MFSWPLSDAAVDIMLMTHSAVLVVLLLLN